MDFYVTFLLDFCLDEGLWGSYDIDGNEEKGAFSESIYCTAKLSIYGGLKSG